MLQNLTGWHALIILAIVLLVFGAAKLPALAKSVGQSMRILKTEVADPAAHRAGDPRPDDTPELPRSRNDDVAPIEAVRPALRAAE